MSDCPIREPKLKEPRLSDSDLNRVVSRIPKEIRLLMESSAPEDSKNKGIFLAGGFVRSCVSRESIEDIDLFTTDLETSDFLFKRILQSGNQNLSSSHVVETENSITFPLHSPPIQVVRKTFAPTPDKLIELFDFTVCSAVVFYHSSEFQRGYWTSRVHNNFYSDLASKTLVLSCENRGVESLENLVRALKFSSRGYVLHKESLVKIISFIVSDLDLEDYSTEEGILCIQKKLMNCCNKNIY